MQLLSAQTLGESSGLKTFSCHCSAALLAPAICLFLAAALRHTYLSDDCVCIENFGQRQ